MFSWPKAEITQTELADRLERPQSFVAKYENGERKIEVVEFVHITGVLGISGSDILERIARAERSS